MNILSHLVNILSPVSQTPAEQIIAKARSDNATYCDMAKRENEVWGRVLPALEVDQAAKADAQASIELEIWKRMSSFYQQVTKRNLHFKKGLTLGCGAGRLERDIMKYGLCDSMHGIDIAESAVAEASRLAEQHGYAITYSVGDMNRLELPEAAYDVVVTQTSLHHILELEHVADQIRKTLKPAGYLWIHDYIGETQAQYDPLRLEVLNGLLQVLPEKLRYNHITKQMINEIRSAIPGQLSSPFEQIRSGEIVDVFKERFDVEWSTEWDTLLHLIAPPGHRVAYTENDDTRALFKVLCFFDDFLKFHEILKPSGGQYLMRPKPVE